MRTYNIKLTQGTFKVEPIEKFPDGLDYSEEYPKKYRVITPNGTTAFYLGKGHEHGKNEVVVWYANSKIFHYSYGNNFQEAIELAINDAWKYI